MAAGPTPRPSRGARLGTWVRTRFSRAGRGTAATGARRLIGFILAAGLVIVVLFAVVVGIKWLANTDPVQAVWSNPLSWGDDDSDNGNDDEEVISVNSEKDAAKHFGGNKDNWREAKDSDGLGWVYKGPKTNLHIPEGFRVDYPNHSCAEPKSDKNTGGVYGDDDVRSITKATVWDVSADEESACPSTSKFATEIAAAAPPPAIPNPSGSGSGPANPGTVSGTSNACAFKPTKPNMYWGPAGVAPQCVDEAAALFGVEPQFLTVLNPSEGDDTVIGWVIGTTGTERSLGLSIAVKQLPSGVCVDFDPGASSVKANFSHEQQFTPKWKRSLLSSEGTANGLKFTVYWTPCIFTDGFKPLTWDGKTVASTSQTDAKLACSNPPTKPEQLYALFPQSKGGSWAPTNFPHGWLFTTSGAPLSLKVVEGVHHIDYDGGKATSGQTTPNGTVFTVWFCQ